MPSAVYLDSDAAFQAAASVLGSELKRCALAPE
jgi:hypothetical protein